jgi:hypothetical protein
VSVIATATNTVTGFPISAGSIPIAFGVFIIRPSFVGTYGFSNCHGQVSRRWPGSMAALEPVM